MVKFLQFTKSRLRQKILAYYFTNPTEQLYLRQLASILKEDPGNLSKELSRLQHEGVFITQNKGNQKYFYLNKSYALYGELKSIIFKTIGIEGQLKKIIGDIKGIQLALIYGSYAAGKERALSDIDLLLVGNPDENKLLREIESLEKLLGREINYNIYPAREFKEKITKKDSFITNVLKRPKIILKGKIYEI